MRVKRMMNIVQAIVLVGGTAGSAAAARASSEDNKGNAGALHRAGIRSTQSRTRVHARPKPLAAGAVTRDWPSFLGPAHDCTTDETKLSKHLSPNGPPKVWEIEKGASYAAPAVSGDRLVLFHRLKDREIVECVHRETADPIWSFAYPTTYTDRFGFGNGPRSSPVIGDGVVYTHGVGGKLHALDLRTGAVLWKRDTSAEYKVPKGPFGVGSTPLIEGNLLIVQVGAPGGPCVVAYDRKTGSEVFKAGDQWTASYASPVPATINGRRRILVFAGGDGAPPTGGLLSIDPADGSVRTQFPFRSRSSESVNAANPVVIGESVFLSTSYATGCVLLKLGVDDKHEVVWKSEALETHFPTPIFVDGHLYGVHGGSKHGTGIVCVDAKTGEQKWRVFPDWSDPAEVDRKGQPIPAGPYRASMVYADGAFLILGEDGHLAWADLSPAGYKELDRTRLFRAEETWTAPVISHGLLYVCQNTDDERAGTPPRLLCYDLRAAR